MTDYEILLEESQKQDIYVIENYNFHSAALDGLYCDNVIALSFRMSIKAKTCILAEELGHYHTTVGNILDQTDLCNLKQERKARMWAYNRLIGLQGLIHCFEKGCTSIYEMAECLEITEQFLIEAIEYYRQKYGERTTFQCYTIFFEPTLLIHKQPEL